MIFLTNHPIVLSVVSVVVLSLASYAGVFFAARRKVPDDGSRDDFGVILGAALTLLGLIIGFSFSMAVTRYDLRRTLEEAEANAIGTEYLRADLLPAAEAARVRTLLKAYTNERLLFYRAGSEEELRDINARTAQVQNDLWAAVRVPALAQPTPLSALAVAGMNDVLNSQGYTQAAWWNRIPIAAWGLMFAIAACCNFLIGYGVHNAKTERRMLVILPLVVSIAFLLIADIDSPRRGIINVPPQNLQSFAESLTSP